MFVKTPDRLTLTACACLTLALLLACAQPSHALLGLFSGPTSLAPASGAVSFPLADLQDGKAHFYTVAAGGKDVRFFALKTADGRVRTAFDACDVCYPEKKGYRQDGDFMVCTNCGRRFHVTMVGEVRGGCNPSPLASHVEGDAVRINLGGIAAGAAFF